MKETRYSLSSILPLFLFSCNNSANKVAGLTLVSKITFEETNIENLNSKTAFSDSVFLLQANDYFHSENAIARSKILLLINGKPTKANGNFTALRRKYGLKMESFDSLLYAKSDDVRVKRTNEGNLDITRRSKKGLIFHLYNNSGNIKYAFLDIGNGKRHTSFRLDIPVGSPSFFLKDITGDGVEELFLSCWEPGYWGYTQHLKIFEVKIP